MTPRAENPTFDVTIKNTLEFFNAIAAKQPSEAFVEVTGSIGDVYLLHPLMLHCASNNKLRQLRIITNPPVSLRQPHNFDRGNAQAYSLVEKKTLKALDVSPEVGLQGWKIQAPREEIVPERVRRWEKAREEEKKRLQAQEAEQNSASYNIQSPPVQKVVG